MNQQNTEKLIKLFKNEPLSYAFIKQNMPNLTDKELISMLFPTSNVLGRLIILSEDISEDEFRRRNFEQEKIIILTEKGQDLLYLLQKEQHQEEKQNESIKWAKYATYLGAAGVIATLLGTIVPALLSR